MYGINYVLMSLCELASVHASSSSTGKQARLIQNVLKALVKCYLLCSHVNLLLVISIWSVY